MEIYKDIKGYKGLYQISNYGNVKSLGNGNSNASVEKVLKNNPDSYGYPRVCLLKNSKHKYIKTHRLVALHFVKNPKNKPFVNHIDEDKTNNHFSNLEWCTCKENNNHGTRNKRMKESKSQKVQQFSKEGELVKVWDSVNQAGRNGFDCSAISRCCNGERKSHRKHTWKYL